MSNRFPFPMPFGWFKTLYSYELQVGEAKPVKYFGKELVMFRTESGQAKVLDAYCPHMGAHLGYGIHEYMGKGGEVKGETIVCPFHGWRFNGDGFCEEVPYAKNMPPKIQGKRALEAYEVRELNNCIYLWHHPEGLAPLWEPLEFWTCTDEEWGGFETYQWVLKSSVQEIVENAFDSGHFLYVHRTASLPVAEMNMEGFNRYACQRAKMATPRGEVDGAIEITGRGPAQAITVFSGICDTALLGHIIPIDDETVQIDFAFMQKKVNGEVPRGGVNKAIIGDIVQQLNEDAPVWENKVYKLNPVLCDADGPIHQFRKWFSQYYVGYDYEADLRAAREAANA